jgi:hypothetical protein
VRFCPVPRVSKPERGGYESPRVVSLSSGFANRGKADDTMDVKLGSHNDLPSEFGQLTESFSLPLPYIHEIDRDLEVVADAWKRLPHSIRSGIEAMFGGATRP